jgi:hypothetical protein
MSSTGYSYDIYSSATEYAAEFKDLLIMHLQNKDGKGNTTDSAMEAQKIAERRKEIVSSLLAKLPAQEIGDDSSLNSSSSHHLIATNLAAGTGSARTPLPEHRMETSRGNRILRLSLPNPRETRYLFRIYAPILHQMLRFIYSQDVW